MKNQKLMVIQKFFDERLPRFQATFPHNCGETDGAWNLGLNVPVLRLHCNSPVVMTFLGSPLTAMAIPWHPSPASDGP